MGGDYFKYFHRRGVINQGMAIIGGNRVCYCFVGPSALLDMNLWI